MYKKSIANDIIIVSVSTDINYESWINALDRFGYPWLHLIDTNGVNAVAKKYGVGQLPTNFLIDKNGIIIRKDISLVDLLKN